MSAMPLDGGRIVTSDGLDLVPGRLGVRLRRGAARPTPTALYARGRDGRHHLLGPAARIGLPTTGSTRWQPPRSRRPAALEPFRTQHLPQYHRARGRDGPRVRRGARDPRGYEPPAAPFGGLATASRARRVVHRGAPRPALPSLRCRRARATSRRRASCPRRARTRPPSRTICAAICPACWLSPTPEAAARLEALIRCYDPCISCATHFLTLDVSGW